MKAWRLDGLGGALTFQDVRVPEVRPGGVLVRIEASTLMSYMKAYVEGRLPNYRVPDRPAMEAAATGHGGEAVVMLGTLC